MNDSLLAFHIDRTLRNHSQMYRDLRLSQRECHAFINGMAQNILNHSIEQNGRMILNGRIDGNREWDMYHAIIWGPRRDNGRWTPTDSIRLRTVEFVEVKSPNDETIIVTRSLSFPTNSINGSIDALISNGIGFQPPFNYGKVEAARESWNQTIDTAALSMGPILIVRGAKVMQDSGKILMVAMPSYYASANAYMHETIPMSDAISRGNTDLTLVRLGAI